MEDMEKLMEAVALAKEAILEMEMAEPYMDPEKGPFVLGFDKLTGFKTAELVEYK